LDVIAAAVRNVVHIIEDNCRALRRFSRLSPELPTTTVRRAQTNHATEELGQSG
jgi:hypothetical protein